MEEHSRFQRNTHYNLETNPFNYSYDILPFDTIKISETKDKVMKKSYNI